MGKHKKTNAIRILENHKKVFDILTYDNTDGKIDGISVSKKIGRDMIYVYKTLIAKSINNNIYVFIIPVDNELDLKKAAKATKEKKIEMIPVKDILKHTGYIRGGCSPIGMKKKYDTYLDDSAKNIDKIIVSAGAIGMQIEIQADQLLEVVNAKYADIIKR